MGYNHYRYARKVASGIEIGETPSTVPNILLDTSGNAKIYGTHKVYFGDSGALFLQVHESGTDTIIKSEVANNDLYLEMNGTGVLKYGTYNAITSETNAGYVTIKDAGGTTRKVCIVA